MNTQQFNWTGFVIAAFFVIFSFGTFAMIAAELRAGLINHHFWVWLLWGLWGGLLYPTWTFSMKHGSKV